MFVGVRRRKRAQEAPSTGSAPCPTGPTLEPRAQGACAEGGAQAVGRCSQRLRRAAASLARTDAIIASPRQTPREFRSPHGNCSSRSRSRLHSPFPRGESESESEISVRPRPAPPPTVANGRGPHAGAGRGPAGRGMSARRLRASTRRGCGLRAGRAGDPGSERAGEARRPCSRSAPEPRRLPGRRSAALSRPRREDAVALARPPSLSLQGLARCSRALRAALPPRWPHLPAVVGALPREGGFAQAGASASALLSVYIGAGTGARFPT